MRDSSRPDHREAATTVDVRLALDVAFEPRHLVLRPTASSLDELIQLADSYAADVDRLRVECARFRARNAQLEILVARLKAERTSVAAAAATGLAARPVRGEVRFYKKRYSTPSYDVVIRVPDCGCNRWSGGHGGHKAREGIVRLEGNRTNWQTVQHCPSCTGGGMWRVKW
jgi:hypothetical protein